MSDRAGQRDAHEECADSSGTRETKAFLSTCTASQQTSRYVTLEIVKDYDPLFTSAGYPDVKADGNVPLKARASLRVQ